MNKQILEEGMQLNLQFEKRNGLLPVIVQDIASKEILMLGYTNEAAFEKTVSTGKATFWSTSRKQLWTKGETSGDYLQIHKIRIDCDQDALVYLVKLMGEGSCHTKRADGKARKSCFYREYDSAAKELNLIDP